MKKLDWFFVGSVVAALMVFATTAEALRMESRLVKSDRASIRLRSNDASSALRAFGAGMSRTVQSEQGDRVLDRTRSRLRSRDSIRPTTSVGDLLGSESIRVISYENTGETNSDNGGVIPEPSAMLVFGMGALLAGTMARRRFSSDER